VVKVDTKDDSVLGSAAKPYGDAAKAAGSMTYKLLPDCTAVAGTDIVNSKQKCTIKHDCTKATPDAVTFESELTVDAGTTGCKSKFTYKTEDKIAPTITLADDKCSKLHGTFETDVGKKTFAEAGLRISTYQTDGFVTDNSGSEVTCAVVGAALGDIAIGNTGERSLECTDKAGQKSTCKFTVTVEDKEVPTFEGDTCGKSQGTFDPKKGETTYKFTIPTVTAKDNSGDAPTITTKVSKNGADCGDCPTEGGKEHDFAAGVYVYTLTAEDKAKNKNYCVYSFTVNFKEDEAPITSEKLDNNGEVPAVTAAKTKQPTKKPTQTPTRVPTLYNYDSDKYTTNSCKNRCDAKGNQLELTTSQAIFTCSCNRAVCTQDKADKTKVACCDDIDTQCKALAVQCTKDNCGSRVTAGKADGKDCFCDHNCAAKGDCCNNFDFNQVCCADNQAGSCKGKCGKADAIFSCKDQRNCYCDDACTNNGDCCADYSTECKK
jgi:predicted lipoprotein with Yx(FWY)xxD motif